VSEPVHPAIALLIARIKSNPEEFSVGGGWDQILNLYACYFTEAERLELSAYLRPAVMEQLHQEVMQRLLGADNAPRKKR